MTASPTARRDGSRPRIGRSGRRSGGGGMPRSPSGGGRPPRRVMVTAAIPMQNPCCSFKLTRVRHTQAEAARQTAVAADAARRAQAAAQAAAAGRAASPSPMPLSGKHPPAEAAIAADAARKTKGAPARKKPSAKKKTPAAVKRSPSPASMAAGAGAYAVAAPVPAHGAPGLTRTLSAVEQALVLSAQRFGGPMPAGVDPAQIAAAAPTSALAAHGLQGLATLPPPAVVDRARAQG